MDLYEKLKTYAASDAYPFHMPGHKRRMGVPEDACSFDITEIEGFDDLHNAQGILKEAQKKAADLYGAKESYFLVNGSTAGILTAISACVRPGGKLLMARASHLAAYHAAQLLGLRTAYLYPSGGAAVRGGVCAEEVWAMLEKDREIEAVFLTSPTYEGVLSDVAGIAKAAHAFGVPLIVDEAHGAHFGFHPYFPESSVKLGADIVVHSLHKTLPSMTQTALLHRCGGLVSGEAIQIYLDIYQTSSPSYVLMASMDACIGLLRERGQELFAAFADRLSSFYEEASSLAHIRVLCREDAKERGACKRDPSKLVLFAEGRTGKWLADSLRKRFSLELEMAAGGYAVALTSIADTQEGFDRLLAALRALDKELGENAAKTKETDRQKQAARRMSTETGAAHLKNEQVLTLAQATRRLHKSVPLSAGEGQISAGYLFLYPPGVPLIVPGERIGRPLLEQIEAYRAAGLTLQGISGAGKIRICGPEAALRGFAERDRD